MDQNQENPKLLDFYFGESASYAHHLASRRLRKWSRGFDGWLAERKSSSRKDTLKHILLAWKRLVRHCSKLPWQLIPSDIDQHIVWLRQEGFAESTINGSIGFFIKASGRKPDHLDSHHHSSFFTPELFRTMLELAKEYDCPIRNPIAYGDNPTAGMPAVANPMADHAPRLMKEFNAISTDTIFVNFYDEGATHAELLDILSKVPEGTSELMCHPGYVDDAFAKESVYNFQREKELTILTDPTIKQATEENGIKLITFADL